MGFKDHVKGKMFDSRGDGPHFDMAMVCWRLQFRHHRLREGPAVAGSVATLGGRGGSFVGHLRR